MADTVKKQVVIQFVAEIREAVDAIQQLKQSMESLSGAQARPGRGNFGQVPPPEPPRDAGPAGQRFGPAVGSAAAPPSPSALNYNAPGSGIPGASNGGGQEFNGVTTVTLNNVAVVNITASMVRLDTGGSMGTGGPTGSQQAVQGMPSGFSPFGTYGQSGFSPMSFDPTNGRFFDPANGAYQVAQGGFPVSMVGGGGGGGGVTPGPPPIPGAGGHTKAMQMFAGLLAQTGIPYNLALGIASKIAPSIPLVGLATAGILGFRGASAGYTASFGAEISGMEQGAGFGSRAISGGFISSEDWMADQIARSENPRIDALRPLMQSTGIYQVLNFVSGGTLDRHYMNIEQSQRLRARIAGVKDQQEVLRTFGGARGSRIAGMNIPDVEGFNGTTAEYNARVSGLLERFASNEISAASLLTQSGLTGIASIRELPGMLGPASLDHKNVLIAEAVTRALIKNVGNMSASGRVEAAMGSTDAQAQFDAARLGWVQGDYSLGNRRLLTGLGSRIDRNELYSIAMAMETSRERQQVSGLEMSTMGSMGTFGAARGMGAGFQQQISFGIAGRAGSIVAELQAQKAALGSNAPPAMIAQFDAQIAQAMAQQAQAEKSGYGAVYNERLSIAGSGLAQAGAQTQLAAFGGVSARSNVGYSAQASAAGASLSTLQAMKNDTNYWSRLNPDEKAQLEAQISQAQLAPIQIQRQRAGDIFGEAQSVTGLFGAQMASGLASAQMFGSTGDIFKARKEELDVTRQGIEDMREYYSNMKKAGATVTELNNIQAQIVQMETKYKTESESTRRSWYSGQILEASAIGGIASSRASMISMQQGTLAAVGETGIAISQAKRNASIKRAEAESLPIGSQQRLLAEREAAAFETQVTSAEIGAMSFSPSVGLQNRMSDTQLRMSIATRTWAGYGDVRASLTEGLQQTGVALGELTQQYRENLRTVDPKNREALTLAYNRQRNQLMEQAIGYQENLESGWMERIIGSVQGSSSNFSMVSPEITRREAAMFYGIRNQYFGGNKEQADYYRSKGGNYLRTYAGQIARPEGAMDTAMSMVGGPNNLAGAVEIQGGLQINVTVDDRDGHIMTKQTQIATMGDQVRAFWKPVNATGQ